MKTRFAPHLSFGDRAAVSALLCALLASATDATDLTVDPWVVEEYADREASVGDTITFGYNSNYHNVLIHPTGDCNEDGAVEIGPLGGDSEATATYTFIESDAGTTVTFACDVGGHCEAGQIVNFLVGTAPTPFPTPSPNDPPTGNPTGIPAIPLPATAGGCDLCPDGVDEGHALGLGALDLCLELIESAKAHKAGSDVCELARASATSCCPAPVEKPCSVCPDGISVAVAIAEGPLLSLGSDDDTDVLTLGPGDADVSASCEQTVESAKKYEADSDMCELMKMSEASCCPVPVENPCSFCPDGITVDENPIPGHASDDASLGDDGFEMDAHITCQQMAASMKMYEADSEMCERSALAPMEMMCCPKPVENPCSICPDGFNQDHLLIVVEGNETMLAEHAAGCQGGIEYLSMLEADSEICFEISKSYEMSCCPSPAENPCSICPDGITVDEDAIPALYDDVLDDGFEMDPYAMCQQTITHMEMFEADSEMCDPNQLVMTEAMCCPTPVENPCSICPDGINQDQFLIFSGGNETMAAELLAGCQGGIDYLNLMEADSEMCLQLSESYEMSCCPSPAENPCSICPDGISVDESSIPALDDDSLDDGFEMDPYDMCEQAVTQMTMFEANSEMCDQDELAMWKAICCPTLVKNPCSICPDGFDEDHLLMSSAGNETMAAELSAVCQGGIGWLSTLGADDEMCLEMSNSYEMSCCPVPIENPCSLCPDGITIDESAGEMEVRGCQDAIAQMKLFPADSEMCDPEELLLWEMSCCPKPVENPCSFCPGGFNEDMILNFGGGNETIAAELLAQCQGWMGWLSMLEADSETCLEQSKSYEMSCCPTPPENPCSLCPDGITVDESAPHGSECREGIEYSKAFDAGSENCSPVYEVMCCPTPAANPCSICPGGIAFDVFNEDIGLSCSEIESRVEEGSEACALVREELGDTCCDSSSVPPDVEATAASSDTIVTEPTIPDAATAPSAEAPATASDTAAAEPMAPDTEPTIPDAATAPSAEAPATASGTAAAEPTAPDDPTATTTDVTAEASGTTAAKATAEASDTVPLGAAAEASSTADTEAVAEAPLTAATEAPPGDESDASEDTDDLSLDDPDDISNDTRKHSAAASAFLFGSLLALVFV